MLLGANILYNFIFVTSKVHTVSYLGCGLWGVKWESKCVAEIQFYYMVCMMLNIIIIGASNIGICKINKMKSPVVYKIKNFKIPYKN